MSDEKEMTDAELETISAGMGKVRATKATPVVAKRSVPAAAPAVAPAPKVPAAIPKATGGCAGGVCPA
jgi:hypothetical protein